MDLLAIIDALRERDLIGRVTQVADGTGAYIMLAPPPPPEPPELTDTQLKRIEEKLAAEREARMYASADD